MISFGDNSFIKYTYSATGEKLGVEYGVRLQPVLSPTGQDATMSENGDADGTMRDRSGGFDPGPLVPMAMDGITYCGNVVYDGNDARLLTDEGYVTFTATGTPQYHYYLRDHLGNIRVVMGQTGALEQVNHYYAFGGLMRESTNPGVQPYKFGGKELDRTSGLDAYDFGARMYFADRMQWGQVDPMCEKYYDVSPYGYCLNSPVNAIDPDGKEIWIYYTDVNGIEQSFQYTAGMQCDVQNSNARTIVSNLNVMYTNESGAEVIDAILGSNIKYGYKQADTHSEDGEGYFNPKDNTVSLNDVNNTLSLAEETFHIFQYVNNQGGTTAVNEVEAKLFSAKMNFEIEEWLYTASFQNKIAGHEGSPYADSMSKLFYNGYNAKDFRTAVHSFFSGSYGGKTYKNKPGYTTGYIKPNPLIKKYLPVKLEK